MTARDRRPGGTVRTGRGPARDAPLPGGTRLVLSPGTKRVPGGVLGGQPLRFVRLKPAGERLLDELLEGAAVPSSAPAQRMARRFFDSGIANPRPATRTRSDLSAFSAVIPVRDDPDGLAATLSALGRLYPQIAVRVVDDGSAGAVPDDNPAGAGLRAISPQSNGVSVSVFRHPNPAGPGAARNSGWRAAGTEFVAFLDAGCIPEPGWLEASLALLADPSIAAVAPRVVSRPPLSGRRSLAAYEAARSPLDMGPEECGVRPGASVPYVPSAALVLRTAALEDAGGFDETMVTGEDVDFVWRLHAAGWRIRYQPALKVTHPARATWAAWARQRWGYGRSAAPLAIRHGDAVAPLGVPAASAAVWGLAVAGLPLSAVAVGALGALAAALTFPRERVIPLSTIQALRLGVEGQLRVGKGMARLLRREWWPLTAAAAVVSRRARRGAAVAVLLPALWEWASRRPALDPIRWVAAGVADDAAYGAGVWAGCMAERSLTALLPRLLSRRPLPGRS